MKWEYKVESVAVNSKWSSKKQQEEFTKLTDQLNELGAMGWEMISYESVPMMGSISNQLHGYSYLVFFKRQI